MSKQLEETAANSPAAFGEVLLVAATELAGKSLLPLANAAEVLEKLGNASTVSAEALRGLHRPQTARPSQSPVCRACGSPAPHGSCPRCQRVNNPNHKIRTR